MTMSYCCREVSELFSFPSELQRIWQRFGANSHKIVIAAGRRNNFCLGGYPSILCTLHTHNTLSISSTELGLQKIVKYEAQKEQWTNLCPMQKSIASIVWVLQSNKTVNGLVTEHQRTEIVQGKVKLEMRVFSTLGTTACCLVKAPTEKSLWNKMQNKWKERKKEFSDGTREMVW